MVSLTERARRRAWENAIVRDAVAGNLRAEPSAPFMPEDLAALRAMLRRGGAEGGRRPIEAISKDGLTVVAEWLDPPRGRATPFHGPEPSEAVAACVAGGVSAFAVGTDAFFDVAHPRRLRWVRSRVDRPVVRVDIVIDEIDVALSRLRGADAVLLHPSLLRGHCARVRSWCRDFDVAPVAVVHGQSDLEIALASGVDAVLVHGWPFPEDRRPPGVAEPLIWQVPAAFPVWVGAGVPDVEAATAVRRAGADGLWGAAPFAGVGRGDRALERVIAAERAKKGGISLPSPTTLLTEAMRIQEQRGPRCFDAEERILNLPSP